MKHLLTAAFAALALGAAQAVTWEWESSSVENFNTSHGSVSVPAVSAWNGSSGTGVMTYVATMTIANTTITEATEILKLYNSAASEADNAGQANANGLSVSITTDGQLTLTASNNKTSWTSSWSDTTTTLDSLLDGQAHTIAIVVNNTQDDVNGISDGGFALYVDGALALEYDSASDGGAYHFWKTELDTLDYGAEGITSDVILAAAEGILDPGQAIPEPTALALLALGVAGVALRRRAA